MDLKSRHGPYHWPDWTKQNLDQNLGAPIRTGTVVWSGPLIRDQGEYEKQKVEIILDPNEPVEEIKIPEIIEYIEDCTSCSILPVVELPVNEDGTIEPPPAGEPMVNSLTGDGIAVDLCAATSNQLIFTVNTAGTPPFQENVQPWPSINIKKFQLKHLVFMLMRLQLLKTSFETRNLHQRG